MKTPRRRPTALQRKNESGLSLVLVLFAVLSLSVLIVLFFSLASNDRSSTSAYTNGMKAEELATNGLELVISDLRKQIVDHSDADTPTGTTGPTIYKLKPGERQYIKPIFSASDSYGNLVAISKAGKSVYPDGNLAGSSDPTTTKSRNGRSFSIDRWAKPALAKEFGDPNASSPVPTWIYMGRSGPITSPTVPTMSKTDDPNYAIGRIAFAIYDISGLIDMNVAGYPSATSKFSAKDAEMKGSVALAKLDSKDDSGSEVALTRDQIDAVVNFRNGTSKSDYSTYLANTTGHQAFEQTIPGDNRFLSRQELLRFANRNNFASKLHLLTVFTRELNTPTYEPDTPNTTNVSLMTTRHTSSGRLLMEQRFPLEKLEIFNSPKTLSSSQDLKTYFGLSYSQPDRTFTYVGGGSDTHIKTFTEIAQEPTYRRPNFFEVLKAVILKDSIGQSAGTTATETDSSDKDAHILQIGANIIDQYDTDDVDPKDDTKRIPIPTTIISSTGTCFGVENLPYVNKIQILGEGVGPVATNEDPMQSSSVKVGPDNYNKNSDSYSFRSAVELWNPHFQKIPSSTDNEPQIQLTITGQTRITMYAADNAQYTAGPAPFTGNNTQPYPGGAMPLGKTTRILTVSETSAQTQNSFRYFAEPRQVRLKMAMDVYPYNKLTQQAGNPQYLTWCYQSANIVFSQPVSVQLSVIDGDGQPRVYQKTLPTVPNLGLKLTRRTTPNDSAAKVAASSSIIHSDPRTNRLGYFGADFHPADKVPVVATGTSTPSGSYPVYANSFIPNPTWAFSIRPKFNKAGESGDPDGYGIATTEQNPGSPYSIAGGGGFAYLGLLWENTLSKTQILDEGKVRMGDGGFAVTDVKPAPSTVPAPYEPIFGYSGVAWPTQSKDSSRPAGTNSSRPVMLDRSFRSAADMGYVYRDIPWRSLNFSSTDSADSGLLDAFNIQDSATVEGRISLNSASVDTLQVLLANSLKEEKTPTSVVTDTQARALAQKIVNYIKSSQGITNISELVTKFSTPANFNSDLGNGANSEPSYYVKTQREAIIRALSGSTQTRTWNFLIDLVAQTGKYPPNATKLGSDFVVEGERRYWLHVAIDRYTSEVVAELLETVNE